MTQPALLERRNSPLMRDGVSSKDSQAITTSREGSLGTSLPNGGSIVVVSAAKHRLDNARKELLALLQRQQQLQEEVHLAEAQFKSEQLRSTEWSFSSALQGQAVVYPIQRLLTDIKDGFIKPEARLWPLGSSEPGGYTAFDVQSAWDKTTATTTTNTPVQQEQQNQQQLPSAFASARPSSIEEPAADVDNGNGTYIKINSFQQSESMQRVEQLNFMTTFGSLPLLNTSLPTELDSLLMLGFCPVENTMNDDDLVFANGNQRGTAETHSQRLNNGTAAKKPSGNNYGQQKRKHKHLGTATTTSVLAGPNGCMRSSVCDKANGHVGRCSSKAAHTHHQTSASDEANLTRASSGSDDTNASIRDLTEDDHQHHHHEHGIVFECCTRNKGCIKNNHHRGNCKLPGLMRLNSSSPSADNLSVQVEQCTRYQGCCKLAGHVGRCKVANTTTANGADGVALNTTTPAAAVQVYSPTPADLKCLLHPYCVNVRSHRGRCRIRPPGGEDDIDNEEQEEEEAEEEEEADEQEIPEFHYEDELNNNNAVNDTTDQHCSDDDVDDSNVEEMMIDGEAVQGLAEPSEKEVEEEEIRNVPTTKNVLESEMLIPSFIQCTPMPEAECADDSDGAVAETATVCV